MKPGLIAFVLFSALLWQSLRAQEAEPSPKPKRPGRDVVIFRNGDVLHGILEGVNGEGVNWKRGDAVGGFTFAPEFISEIQLGGAIANPGFTNNCTVQLVNGDYFQGKLLSYDGEKVTMETWFGGEMSLPKEAIGMLLPINPSRMTVFEGPDGLEGWTMGKVNNAAALVDSGQWYYKNGAFYATKSASIARDVHLPDACSFQFDLEWRGFFHIAVALYTQYLHPVNLATKENEPQFGGFYSLQINPFSANLLPVKQNEPLRYLGQAPLQALAQKSSARFDVRVNKAKKTIALLVDGMLVKQWMETDDFAGTGTAIRFVHQGQGAVKISNIKISEWDGQFEEPPSLTPNKSQDMARLRNGDRIAGPVKGISGNRITIEAAGTTLDIPMARVKQVELAAGKVKPSKLNPRTVKAYFTGQGVLTFDLEDWSPEGLVAKSENFGTVRLKPSAFSRLLFDLAIPAGASPN